MRLVPFLALTIISGCAFVTEGEYNDVIESLDADGDGVPDGDDCDSTNPLVYPAYAGNPGAPEIVADGIDNDCELGDELDADGDGYPFKTEEEYRTDVSAALNIDYNLVQWPASLRSTKDCDDNDPNINPAAADAYYDGIDSNCQRDNDFDQDGDGQMPARLLLEGSWVDIEPLARAYFDAHPTVAVDPDVPLAFADCDDDDRTIYGGSNGLAPGAEPEPGEEAPGDVLYDGKDTDCAGDNDFDADGDGYIPAAYDAAYQLFVDEFHPETNGEGPADWAPDGYTTAQTGDCLDITPDVPFQGGIGHVDPFEVHPNAVDTIGDGIDSDCAGDNDFDADGDGVAADIYDRQDLAYYLVNWGQGGGLPTTVTSLDIALGDCDDANAAVRPGQTEALFDPTDYDCDGDGETAGFGHAGFLWESPEHPRAIVNNTHFVLGTTAVFTRKPVLGGGNLVFEHPAIVFAFDNLAATTDGAFQELRWDNLAAFDPYYHGASFDMVPDGDDFWVVSTFEQFADRFQFRSARFRGNNNYASPTSTTSVLAGTELGQDADLDATIVGDNLYMVSSFPALDASQSGGIRTTVLNTISGQINSLSQKSTTIGIDGNVCRQDIDLDANEATYTICDDSSCEQVVMELTNFTLSPPTAAGAEGYVESDSKGDLIVEVRSGVGGLVITDEGSSNTYLAGETVLSGDALWVDTTGDGAEDTLFIAAVVAGAPNVLQLGWTTDATIEPTNYQILDVDDPSTEFRHTCDAQDTPVCAENVEGLEDTDNDGYPNTVETALGTDPFTAEDPLPEACNAGEVYTCVGREIEPIRVDLNATSTRLAVVYTGTSQDIATYPVYQGVAIPQDALGWAFFSFYPDLDNDGYPNDPAIDATLLDPDDSDASVTP